MPQLSESRRMQAVQAPIIPVVAELIRATPGTLSLGQGVAYYGPPSQALDAVHSFEADPDNHKYKLVQGIDPLLEVIAHKLRRDNGMALDDGQHIVVTAGGNMAFMNALMAITDPGDEVILPLPYYFNHEMAIGMVNCRAVCVPTDAHYQLRLDAISRAITERTRAVVTVSPNNPAGVVYPEADLRAVNRLCRQAGIYHISDEAYEYFTYDGARHFSPGSLADSQAHTISLYSLSKAYGFASWRIGWMVVPEHLYTAVKKAQDTIVICPPVVSQHAAVAAMRVGPAYCRDKLSAMTASPSGRAARAAPSARIGQPAALRRGVLLSAAGADRYGSDDPDRAPDPGTSGGGHSQHRLWSDRRLPAAGLLWGAERRSGRRGG